MDKPKIEPKEGEFCANLEGKTHLFNNEAIAKKIENKEDETFINIPVVLYLNSLRIGSFSQNENGQCLLSFKEIIEEDEKYIPKHVFDFQLISFLKKNKIKTNEQKKIVVSIFSQNRDLENISKEIREKIRNAQDTRCKEYLQKIGFVPTEEFDDYKIEYKLYDLCEQNLIYHLYSCYKKKIKIEKPLLLLKFDKEVITYAIHNEGNIFTKLKGVKISLNKNNCEEYALNVIENANDECVGVDVIFVDRGSGQAHHAWTCFPDGRDPRELNGNTRINAKTTPRMEMNIRQIPDSRKYVSTATPHHGWAAGSLIVIDPSVPDDGEMSAIRRVTPEQPFPEAEQNTFRNRNSGAYATAWPLSEKYYICAYDGNANGMYNVPMRGRRYAITLVDVFGNKTRLYTHPGTSCLDPMPIGARKKPPVIPHKTLEGAPRGWVYPENPVKTGEIGLINVYDTRIPFPTNETITALRVWQLFPKVKPLQQKPWLGAEVHQTGRQCLGTVPVEKDGSAYFTAPVGVPLFFQALRADGCAVQSMRSDTYLHPGERLLCAGCHEPKENTRRAAFSSLPLAMRRAPSAIKPGPDGSAPFNYARLVQPVLDAKCVSCHGEKRKPKAPDLRAGDWRKDKWGFSTSWSNLVHRTNYFAWEMVERKRTDWAFFTPAYTEPGRYLAMNAPLRKMLDAGHHGVKLTPEERERLILWMDSNGQYIAHDHDPEAQRDGKIVPPALE